MRLLHVERATFGGPAAFLADDAHRADVAAYIADLGTEPGAELTGQSYGEMAGSLLTATVTAAPIDLLVLAFAVHDMWPGRATATYLSHRCPGTPLSFAVCDQGGAAAFTGLRLIRDSRPRRALLIVVEQAALPYATTAPMPREHRGIAMVYGDGAGSRLTDLRQHPDVAPDDVPPLAARLVKELSAGRPDVRLVLGDTLAAAWPDRPDHTRGPERQPATGVWWGLADALTGPAGLVVIGDYDRELRYLCLAGIEVCPATTGRTTKEQP